MSDFVHLHVHSEYSLIDGLSKIPKLIAQTKLLGMKHIALTDHGNLYGAIKFYKECKKENVNPIIGCEVYIAKRKLQDKESGLDNENYHLTLLAKDFVGYQNLLKLVTIAHLEGFYYRPRLDKETLAKYSSGLIALSGCMSSEVSRSVILGKKKETESLITAYQEIFGKENFYLEIQRHLFGKFKTAHEKNSEIYRDLDRMATEEDLLLKSFAQISKSRGIDLVATNDLHYVHEQDAQAQDAIVCIQTGKMLSDIKRLRMIDSNTYYLKSKEEMADLFSDFPKALENTVKIAQKVNIEIPLGVVAFPKYDTPGESAENYLKKICDQKIKDKFEKVTEDIQKRLDYELSVITKKGYATYFLVVSDFVNWSRKQGIISTTRGSASGSLVSYILGITTVNPLYFKLPFERFLNLYRPTLPDIDVDFADNRRDDVLEYVRDQYGRNNVAQIGTFGTMMARQAIRDVARVLNLPYSKADRIAKMIPLGSQGFHMSLANAMKLNKELGALTEQDSEVKELMDLAQKVEGNVRHVSVHAAGVVIAPTDLNNFTALQKETSGEKIITQFDMHDIEEVGLVKMDFLGIRNLSILGQSVEIVANTTGKKVDLSTIPLDDKKAFEIMAKGETMGLFQLSGSGMTRYLKELKPSNIFDIMAMISLFRPGPMNSIPEFIQRKHNSKKIKFFDPRMADYLKESYGVIVYQDDVLLTAINIAGYSWEEADKFRKAMGKKIPAEMSKQKEKFTEGCIRNGMTIEKSDQLFKLIEPFAAYGFNKAHAASYAVIAYQTAYMKANYPVEFMAAVMTAESDDTDKIASAVNECSRMNISILPPDVNASSVGFVIENLDKKRGIRFGLSAIKNVGKAAIEAIIGERKEGAYKSLSDFINRVNLRVVNRKTLESLIKAGALDSFGKRNGMLKILDEIKASGVSLSKKISEGQVNLFSDEEIQNQSKTNDYTAELEGAEEAPKSEILSWERELLGLYLSEHPLNEVADQLFVHVSTKITDIDPIMLNQRNITIGGIINSIRKTLTKVKKEEMCFIKIQDTSGSMDVVVFPRVYEQAREKLLADQIVIISGRLDADEQSVTLIAEKIMLLDETVKNSEITKELEIKIPLNSDRILLSKIYEILKSNQGDIPTYLILPSTTGQDRKIQVPFGAQKNKQLLEDLAQLGCEII